MALRVGVDTPAKRSRRKHYDNNKQAYIDRALAQKKARREWLDEIKSNPCLDCGVQYPPIVMEFDHRPGEAKVSHVANMLRDGIGKARILVEISKCDLVCSNCHRIRTWKRQQES